MALACTQTVCQLSQSEEESGATWRSLQNMAMERCNSCFFLSEIKTVFLMSLINNTDNDKVKP